MVGRLEFFPLSCRGWASKGDREDECTKAHVIDPLQVQCRVVYTLGCQTPIRAALAACSAMIAAAAGIDGRLCDGYVSSSPGGTAIRCPFHDGSGRLRL